MNKRKQRGIGGSHGYKLPKLKIKSGGVGGAKHGITPAKGYKLSGYRLPKIRLDY